MRDADLKTRVLGWLESMRVAENGCRFRLSASTDDSIFTSCFALYLLDLFRVTETFTARQRQQWSDYIQGFQSRAQGYFEPARYHHPDRERNRYQLTCFCLSALKILDSTPRYPLSFLKRFQTEGDVVDYLKQRGCHEGRPGSGNKAMFLAVFLTHALEQSGEKRFRSLLDVWFDFHDRHQNESGFWGRDRSCYGFHGLQNGLHQFVVYWYWQRPLAKLDRIVDVALNMQDREGFFAPLPGGEACHDYDAIHVLVNGLRLTEGYREKDIRNSLERARNALLANQNRDGGFCQSRKSLRTFADMLRTVPFILSGGGPDYWLYRLRRCASVVKHRLHRIDTGWTATNRSWPESSLWDTWFRCLSLAEIADCQIPVPGLSRGDYRFQKGIGLGQHHSFQQGQLP